MSAPAVYRTGLGAYARSPQAAAAVAQRLDFEKLIKELAAPQREASVQEDKQATKAAGASKPRKSFQLHIGASLPLPTDDAVYVPSHQQQDTAAALRQRRGEGIYDPFEGLPLRAFAERLGARFEPVAQVIRDEHRRKQREAVKGLDASIAASDADAALAAVPSFLPCTRWAARSDTVRETLVAAPAAERKRARLSWYHPGDSMVPRDWFRGGLLEDLRYYNPFNLGGALTPSSSSPGKGAAAAE